MVWSSVTIDPNKTDEKENKESYSEVVRTKCIPSKMRPRGDCHRKKGARNAKANRQPERPIISLRDDWCAYESTNQAPATVVVVLIKENKKFPAPKASSGSSYMLKKKSTQKSSYSVVSKVEAKPAMVNPTRN